MLSIYTKNHSSKVRIFWIQDLDKLDQSQLNILKDLMLKQNNTYFFLITNDGSYANLIKNLPLAYMTFFSRPNETKENIKPLIKNIFGQANANNDEFLQLFGLNSDIASMIWSSIEDQGRYFRIKCNEFS